MSFAAPAARTIIHVDLDAFFCAVEEQRDPGLKGKPFAVGGRPEARGVVASCSYAARAFGVHSAMSMAAARRLCPNLIIVPPRFSEYRAASQRVMALLRGWTSQLEQISIDEAFLDVTELVAQEAEPPEDLGRTLALRLQRQVREELALSCSLGVASNKLVAKIATDYGKAAARKGLSPFAVCVVPAGEEAAFLAPLPVSALWGVGPKMEARLAALRIHTVGDLAAWPQRDLAERFGRNGFDLSQHARGIDKREIVTSREAKSVSSEVTFVRDVQDWDELYETLAEQAQSVARQLQKQDLKGTTVKVKVRWTDFSITTRQVTLPHATAEAKAILEAATPLLKHLWLDEQPVRLLGVGMTGLNPVMQLSLWGEEAVAEPPQEPEPPHEDPTPDPEAEAEAARRELRRQQLRAAINRLEAKFGAAVVQVGAEIK
jgi:DNA polymerase-4